MSSISNKLLWEIVNPEHPYPSYLFGTMHIGDLRALQNKEVLFEKIDACDSFALEYNLEESSFIPNPSFFLLPDNKSIEDYIGTKKYLKLQRIIQKAFD